MTPEDMVKWLNHEARKHGLKVQARSHRFEVVDGTGLTVYASSSSEDVACYFGRLEIAARFKEPT